jgi:hypothetical protein
LALLFFLLDPLKEMAFGDEDGESVSIRASALREPAPARKTSGGGGNGGGKGNGGNGNGGGGAAPTASSGGGGNGALPSASFRRSASLPVLPSVAPSAAAAAHAASGIKAPPTTTTARPPLPRPATARAAASAAAVAEQQQQQPPSSSGSNPLRGRVHPLHAPAAPSLAAMRASPHSPVVVTTNPMAASQRLGPERSRDPSLHVPLNGGTGGGTGGGTLDVSGRTGGGGTGAGLAGANGNECGASGNECGASGNGAGASRAPDAAVAAVAASAAAAAAEPPPPAATADPRGQQHFPFETDTFAGTVCVHLRGLPTTQPTVFEGKKRLFHVVIQGSFRRRVAASSFCVGQEFLKPGNAPAWVGEVVLAAAARSFSASARVDARGAFPYFMNPVLAASQLVNVSRRGQEPEDPWEAREDLTLWAPELRELQGGGGAGGGGDGGAGAPLSAERRRRWCDVPTNLAGRYFGKGRMCGRDGEAAAGGGAGGGGAGDGGGAAGGENGGGGRDPDLGAKNDDGAARGDDDDDDLVWTFHLYQHLIDFSSYRLSVGPFAAVDLAGALDRQPLQLTLKDVDRGEYAMSFLVWHERLLYPDAAAAEREGGVEEGENDGGGACSSPSPSVSFLPSALRRPASFGAMASGASERLRRGLFGAGGGGGGGGAAAAARIDVAPPSREGRPEER